MMVLLHGGPRAGQTMDVQSLYGTIAIAQPLSWRDFLTATDPNAPVAPMPRVGHYVYRACYPEPELPALFWRGWSS